MVKNKYGSQEIYYQKSRLKRADDDETFVEATEKRDYTWTIPSVSQRRKIKKKR